MSKNKLLLIIVLLAVVTAGTAVLLHGHNVQVLNPAGTIGHQERQLMYFALGLSLIVVIPVFAMLFGFAWKYREDNPRKQKYRPDWDHNPFIEGIWWLIPGILIAILSVVTWNSSHRLDPYHAIDSRKPLTIQVVALDWKWLFIYPGQNIATVNYVQIPVNTPVNFQITADAPMNSFWVPQLGGQIYAMPGMATQLHLEASKAGDFHGSSANISGDGFSGMTFTVHAGSQVEFGQWVQSVKKSPNRMTLNTYNNLAEPSKNNPVAYYAGSQPNLYEIIISKYMEPIQGISDADANGPGHITSTTNFKEQLQ